jgi:hypothetical protein
VSEPNPSFEVYHQFLEMIKRNPAETAEKESTAVFSYPFLDILYYYFYDVEKPLKPTI